MAKDCIETYRSKAARRKLQSKVKALENWRDDDWPIPPGEDLTPSRIDAFEEWWAAQHEALEMPVSMKFAAWNGWLAKSNAS
jgi:hypothetical protein